MTVQPSRRAFLTGGRLFSGPWGRFCHRLSRLVKGKVEDLTSGRDDPGTARLVPARREDVYHARALCSEMNVQMALHGAEVQTRGQVLWVDPRHLRALEALEGGAWRCEPGVVLGDLKARGLCRVAAASDDEPVVLWLSRLRGEAAEAALRADGAGLESAEVLLFDGQSDRLARFGATTQRAPLGPALRDVVTESFRLAQRATLQPWRESGQWPARYRLDALWREEPNLAHLLIGSQGTLAWVESLEWRPVADGSMPIAAPAAAPPVPADLVLATWVDEQVKESFDPQDVLPRLPADRQPA